jgi:two-component system, LytTR family, response regulator
MKPHLTTLPVARNEVEFVARQLEMTQMTLPFWGYRKPVSMHRIIRLEGAGNYTHFYFDDGTSLIVSLTLKRIESRLPANVFARTHKKNLINLLYLQEVAPVRQPFSVVLSNGDSVEISRRKATQFYRQLEEFEQQVRLMRND